MKVKTSNKSAVFEKKPHIKRGYYAGKLKEVKPRQREDGVAVEGQYGKQIILLWEVFDEAGKKAIVNPVNEEDLIIASVCYSEYKQKDGSYRTAFTPNSAITGIFKALGWGGPDSSEELDLDKYVGEWATLNIDEYDAERDGEDGKKEKYKASTVKDVSIFEEEVGEESPSSTSTTVEEQISDLVKDEVASKLAHVQKLFEDGHITEKGFNTAKEQLEAGIR
jgi:hypothetical protein